MARGLRFVVVVLGLVAAMAVATGVLNRHEPSAALSATSPPTTAPVPTVESTVESPILTRPTTTATARKPTTPTTTPPMPSTTTAPITVTTARPTTTVRRTPTPAQPASAAGNTAGDALGLLNQDRTSRGLPALPVRADAQAKAQAWAEKLARDNALSHSNLAQGLTQCWTGVGENVAMGPSVAQDEQLLMADPQHRGNILAATWTAVGVGVARANGGYVVVQVFVTGC